MSSPYFIGEYMLDAAGILYVKQNIACNSCDGKGGGYINMSIVAENDTLPTLACPSCGEYTLYISTYRKE